MHKLDMSLAEKAPRFQCVRCSPLRSCSGRPCIHSKGASLCSALLCSRVRNPERVSSERRPLSAWESIARALPRARLRISAGEECRCEAGGSRAISQSCSNKQGGAGMLLTDNIEKLLY
nr:uncharacterized protein LOC105465682 isoform X1 [Macaca nemestrina]